MSHKILIIDNYDSFTYNLYQLIGSVLESQQQPFGTNYQLDIIRNDELTLEQIKARNYTHIVISPGPGSPDNPQYFGVCSQVILELGQTIPVLGICLGMQGICYYFGGQVVRANNIMHGKTSTIKHNSQGLFKGISQDIQVMRYHSLVCTDLPDCLIPLAWTNDDNELMGLRRRDYPIFGLQFHPESFATEFGVEMVENFLDCFILRNDGSSLELQSGVKSNNFNNNFTMSFYTIQQQILSGELSTDQILEILQKPITKDDFGDILTASYEAQIPFDTNIDCLDIVGTGGDGLDTFNISTIASLLCASLGIAVAKHGNRSASSVCGSADFVELLGYPLNLSYDQSHQLLVETNFCFLFALQYNPAFRFAREGRSQLGCPSYFNLLGSLLNPAKPKFVSLGISANISDALPYSFDFMENVLKNSTTSYAIVQADNGMDEVSVEGNSKVILNGNKINFDFSPNFSLNDLKVRNKQDCIKAFFDILDAKSVDDKVEAVLLNSALAMQVVNGFGFETNYQVAKDQIVSGRFKQYILFLLGKIKEITRVQGSILSQIVENKKLEVRDLELQKKFPYQGMATELTGVRTQIALANQFQIICEIKPKSPSAGVLRKKLDLIQILAQFDDFGATGISVLTDHKYFGGSVDLFQQVRGLTSKPLLQKDFVINTSQIVQAKNIGANMILVIVKILQRNEIIEFLELAQKLDLQVLLEINNVLEYNLIKDLLPEFDHIIVGVNNRNLETLETDLQVSLDLASVITHTKWSLSGIKSKTDIDMLKTAGYNGVLIGTALAI